nr:acyltransferase family protein [Kocuria rosea]
MRAVAVLMVVIYHVFLGRVSGGVDIFLLITAFFLTRSFTRKLESGRPLAIPRYWVHVFQRLLPLAALTIAGTLALVAVFYSPLESLRSRTEAWASLFYVENWALALNAVDYYAADRSAASPFQHFWSLSVQGQVYVLWPLVFGLAWLLTRRGRWKPVPVLFMLFGTIFVASLVWSIQSTAANQTFAYFDTRARLWEFALGSLLALALPFVRLPRRMRVVLGWVGAVSMLSVGVLINVQGAFPGWLALWPLLSAGAIIVAGNTGSERGVDKILASPTLVRLGDAAYALYLVHWPLLVTYAIVTDRPMPGLAAGSAIVLGSIFLALLITKFVEKPLQQWDEIQAGLLRPVVAIAVCLGVVMTPLTVWHQLGVVQQGRNAASMEAAGGVNGQPQNMQEVANPGAAVLEPGARFQANPEAPTIPLPEVLYEGFEPLGEDCPSDWTSGYTGDSGCRVVREGGPDSTVVWAVGNSHVEQWMPALQTLAEERDWTLVAIVQPGCFFTAEHINDDQYVDCVSWYSDTRALVEERQPEVLFTQATYDQAADGDEEYLVGYEAETAYWTERGSTVIGIRDNPRWDMDHTECAIDKGADDPSCSRELGGALGSKTNPAQELERTVERFGSMDMTEVLCPKGKCPPAIGNVWVYEDTDHVSQDYARTAAPQFGEAWDQAMEQAGQ